MGKLTEAVDRLLKSLQITSAGGDSPKINEVLPLLYLKGISTGQMQEVTEHLYGNTFSGGSAASVSRFKETWQEQYVQWQQRDLSDCKYCYIWVDGIHFNVRLEDDRYHLNK